jgi:hypothetical protein
MNVFYNVSTWTDQLDEYDWIYLDKTALFVDPPAGGSTGVPGTPSATVPPRGNCTPPAQGGAFDCFTTPVTQAQFIQRESSAVLGRMLANDPRPHYAHQTNLISDPNAASVANRGDGILYAVLSAALTDYRTYMTTTIQQPGMTALRDVLRRQIAWDTTTSTQVNGYIQDGKINIVSTIARDVPITGTTTGDLYGGQRSGWLTATNTTTTLNPDNPHNTTTPAMTGVATPGTTVSTTDGSWTGTAPITFARQWQRRANATAPWVDIPAATGSTYVVVAADAGQTLRAVITARNRISTWSMATTSPSAPPPVAPANTATPTVSGNTRTGQTLTSSNGTWTGTTPLTFTYQWQRSNNNGATWSSINGATARTFTLRSSDQGYRIRAGVTARNVAGSAQAFSPAVGPVTSPGLLCGLLGLLC